MALVWRVVHEGVGAAEGFRSSRWSVVPLPEGPVGGVGTVAWVPCVACACCAARGLVLASTFASHCSSR